MSSKASFRRLQAGENASITNETGKPLQVVVQTASGGQIRTVLAIGAHIELTLGQDSGTLYMFEPEEAPQRLHVVREGADR